MTEGEIEPKTLAFGVVHEHSAATDIRLLEFHKAHQILGRATRAKDYFKRELERRLFEQKETVHG